MEIAYVGVGSNLDEPGVRVAQALEALHTLPRTRVQAVSSLYRSAPLGVTTQPDFINAAARLHTGLAAHALLGQLQALETTAARRRDGVRWGPRRLDLDLLLYGEQRIADAELMVPHPELHRRAFVLLPLLELEPSLCAPGLGALAEFTAAVATQRVERLVPGVARAGCSSSPTS